MTRREARVKESQAISKQIKKLSLTQMVTDALRVSRVQGSATIPPIIDTEYIYLSTSLRFAEFTLEV
jgi:hypothetical protein